MISFTILTTTPAVLRDQLIARDVIKQVTQEGQTVLVGVREGLEWIEVPTPIKASGSGTELDPYVADSRRCYLVKLVRTAEDNECEGEPRDERALLLRTKLGKWIAANSVAETLTSVDGKSWPSRRVGNNFWAVASDDFGVWQ
jgi:hypothetical protein